MLSLAIRLLFTCVNDLLTIRSLNMYPTAPSIPSTVVVLVDGTFKEDLPSVGLAFNIVSYFKDGTSGQIQGGDDLCNGWISIKQSGAVQCPPTKEPATMSRSIEVPRGWVHEVT